jgi:hypothetical protein
MRHLAIALVFGLAAGPALAAQPLLPPTAATQAQMQVLQSQIEIQQDLAARRAVIQENQLNALDVQRRAEAAAAAIQAAGRAPHVPPPPPGAPPPAIELNGLASMPDDVLAASNARAKAAAENRR